MTQKRAFFRTVWIRPAASERLGHEAELNDGLDVELVDQEVVQRVDIEPAVCRLRARAAARAVLLARREGAGWKHNGHVVVKDSVHPDAPEAAVSHRHPEVSAPVLPQAHRRVRAADRRLPRVMERSRRGGQIQRRGQPHGCRRAANLLRCRRHRRQQRQQRQRQQQRPGAHRPAPVVSSSEISYMYTYRIAPSYNDFPLIFCLRVQNSLGLHAPKQNTWKERGADRGLRTAPGRRLPPRATRNGLPRVQLS